MSDKIRKELYNVIKKLEGNLLSIGVEDNLVIDQILKNDKINQNYNIENKKMSKKDKENGLKEVNIRKIHKNFKFKVNNLLCDINGINIYLNTVIKQSYKIVIDKVILYGISNKYDIAKIINKYERYGAKTKVINDGDNYLLIIDVNNLKINVFIKLLYTIRDFFIDIIDAIGNGLMQ